MLLCGGRRHTNGVVACGSSTSTPWCNPNFPSLRRKSFRVPSGYHIVLCHALLSHPRIRRVENTPVRHRLRHIKIYRQSSAFVYTYQSPYSHNLQNHKTRNDLTTPFPPTPRTKSNCIYRNASLLTPNAAPATKNPWSTPGPKHPYSNCFSSAAPQSPTPVPRCHL